MRLFFAVKGSVQVPRPAEAFVGKVGRERERKEEKVKLKTERKKRKTQPPFFLTSLRLALSVLARASPPFSPPPHSPSRPCAHKERSHQPRCGSQGAGSIPSVAPKVTHGLCMPPSPPHPTARAAFSTALPLQWRPIAILWSGGAAAEAQRRQSAAHRRRRSRTAELLKGP